MNRSRAQWARLRQFVHPIRTCQFSKRTNLAITQNLYVGLFLAYGRLPWFPAGANKLAHFRLSDQYKTTRPRRFQAYCGPALAATDLSGASWPPARPFLPGFGSRAFRPTGQEP